jgi:hypothetical protein
MMSPRTVPRADFPAAGVARSLAIGLAAAVTLAFSCDDPVAPAGSESAIIIAFGEDVSGYPQDDWDLVDGSLVGDTLELRVRYAGGCEEHRFRLLAVDDWIDLPTFGPISTYGVPLLLSHDANGDACEAALTGTLRFGLEPLRDAYRDRYGAGPARLLLQITDGRDGFAIHIFDWLIGDPSP